MKECLWFSIFFVRALLLMGTIIAPWSWESEVRNSPRMEKENSVYQGDDSRVVFLFKWYSEGLYLYIHFAAYSRKKCSWYRDLICRKKSISEFELSEHNFIGNTARLRQEFIEYVAKMCLWNFGLFPSKQCLGQMNICWAVGDV